MLVGVGQTVKPRPFPATSCCFNRRSAYTCTFSWPTQATEGWFLAFEEKNIPWVRFFLEPVPWLWNRLREYTCSLGLSLRCLLWSLAQHHHHHLACFCRKKWCRFDAFKDPFGAYWFIGRGGTNNTINPKQLPGNSTCIPGIPECPKWFFGTGTLVPRYFRKWWTPPFLGSLKWPSSSVTIGEVTKKTLVGKKLEPKLRSMYPGKKSNDG